MKSHSKSSLPGSCGTEKVEIFAERLDTIMFRRAASLEAYGDVQTLESRTNALLTQMFGRCLQKANSQERTSRGNAMRLILGRDQLRNVVKLVKDIKRLQLAPNPYNDSIPSPMLETVDSAAPRVEITAMDKPLRDLFLNTPIVSAFELTRTECLNDVPWEELIAESQKVVEDYRTWLHSITEEAHAHVVTSPFVDTLEHQLEAAAGDLINTFDEQQSCRSEPIPISYLK